MEGIMPGSWESRQQEKEREGDEEVYKDQQENSG